MPNQKVPRRNGGRIHMRKTKDLLIGAAYPALFILRT